jgi:hypothetical protein
MLSALTGEFTSRILIVIFSVKRDRERMTLFRMLAHIPTALVVYGILLTSGCPGQQMHVCLAEKDTHASLNIVVTGHQATL